MQNSRLCRPSPVGASGARGRFRAFGVVPLPRSHTSSWLFISHSAAVEQTQRHRRTVKAAAAPGPPSNAGPCATRTVDGDWMEVMSCDFLVIGSGIAGLSYALKVASKGRVIMISKETANEGSTAYAQGGISAVFGKDDSVESHIQDTMRAGGYLNTYE